MMRTAVSKPCAGASATGASDLALAPANTRQLATSVAPFQLAYTVSVFPSVDVAIDGPVSAHMGAGTQFWIEQPELAKGQIRSLMAGSYVDVEPVNGAHKTVFDGLEAPPVLPADQPGRRFILTADDATGLSRGAPILYRGVQVGRVLGLRLNESRKQAEIYVFVKAADADLVRQDSSFWRAGGVSVSLAKG